MPKTGEVTVPRAEWEELRRYIAAIKATADEVTPVRNGLALVSFGARECLALMEEVDRDEEA